MINFVLGSIGFISYEVFRIYTQYVTKNKKFDYCDSKIFYFVTIFTMSLLTGVLTFVINPDFYYASLYIGFSFPCSGVTLIGKQLKGVKVDNIKYTKIERGLINNSKAYMEWLRYKFFTPYD